MANVSLRGPTRNNQIDIDATKSNIHTSSSFHSAGFEQNTHCKTATRKDPDKKELPKLSFVFGRVYLFYILWYSHGRSTARFYQFFLSINRARSKILWNVLQNRCLPKSLVKSTYSTNQLTMRKYSEKPCMLFSLDFFPAATKIKSIGNNLADKSKFPTC